MSGRLTAVLVLLGALVAGGVIGVLLVAVPEPAPPAPPPPAPRSPSPSAAPQADQVATTTLAHALADAIARGDSAEFGTLTCRPQSAAALAELQQKWTAAGPLRASPAGPPIVAGDDATVTIRVEGRGGHKDTPFPLHRENGRWCVPG
ncbi:hypothetical protein [Amycolatopsis jejuensis]|uniref:hypothetical protein n=1 Tax=Amycolatopsis jejuensis TaxID=330084 RepID=UPI000526BCF5|nr:hypothetical protein [Amycolatopsis jejuensis]